MNNYAVFIASRHFESMNDFANLEIGCKRFQGNTSKFFYNPITMTAQDIEHFPFLRTQYLYSETDKIYEKNIKNETLEAYEKWYTVSYGEYLEGRSKKITCDVVKFTRDDCNKYCGDKTTFKIPNEVTLIEDLCFYGCDELKEITIPENVTSIGNLCFSVCKELEEITIPERVDFVGGMCFGECDHLKRVNILAKLTCLPPRCFIDCYMLQEINIPASVISIEENCFKNCCDLKKIKIPESVRKIERNCFKYTDTIVNIEYAHNGENLDVIARLISELGVNRVHVVNEQGERINDFTDKHREEIDNGYIISESGTLYMFQDEVNRARTNIEISGKVTSLADCCFNWYSELKSFKIPNGVISMGYKCFANCKSLQEIAIPESVRKIERNCFKNCESLEKINIPARVISIGKECFKNCKWLEEITIPASITYIGNDCFFNCESLKEIKVVVAENGENEEVIEKLRKEYGKKVILLDKNQKGEKKGKIAMAKKMLIKGYPIAYIVDMTDLSKEEIEKIK